MIIFLRYKAYNFLFITNNKVTIFDYITFNHVISSYILIYSLFKLLNSLQVILIHVEINVSVYELGEKFILVVLKWFHLYNFYSFHQLLWTFVITLHFVRFHDVWNVWRSLTRTRVQTEKDVKRLTHPFREALCDENCLTIVKAKPHWRRFQLTSIINRILC